MSRPPIDPAREARRELRRAFAGLALAPLRLGSYALERDAICAGVARDLDAPQPTPREPEPTLPGERALRLFVSCGEASSEAHAVRAVQETDALLREAGAPPASWVGLGGDALAAAGVETCADPTARAVMGGQGVLGQLGFWRGVLTAAGEAALGCDAALVVDAPALHVPMARILRRAGVPVVHHVAPQYWAWAPWRVRAYRKAVTRALCILPFEEAWFTRHHVPVEYVGHPQVDLLPPAPPPPDDPGRDRIALLPGSRAKEIDHVLPVMLASLDRGCSGARAVVLQRDERHADRVRGHLAGTDVELVIGDPHPELGRARAALATSGTVLLDLLHHRLPTVVLYALTGRLRSRFASWLVTVPHFAAPNLLAGREVLPEVPFPAEAPPPPGHVGALLDRCYNDADWRRSCLWGLDHAARRLGPPGAARRAAGHLLEVATT